jgi:predicted nucleotidyltransferase
MRHEHFFKHKEMDTIEVIDKLQQIKPYLQQEYAVKTLGLFGSFADNTCTDSSDIDIMVEFERPVGWRFFTLEKYLEKAFNRKIDLVTVSALKEQMKPFILSQVLPILSL